ncbi:hypothetical protein DL765_005413 [Monosporascus sp. GIB2]|nr:hypothetical protein DL765_005413 [Monosporascus sp. GIB2]
MNGLRILEPCRLADILLKAAKVPGVSGDSGATPDRGSCDATEFAAFLFFPTEDVYCQWAVDSSTAMTCAGGTDGSFMDFRERLRPRGSEFRQANWSALLHVRELELVWRLEARPIELPFEA